MASRRRSAWPLWRAYSSIMWTSTQRSETRSRLRRDPTSSSDVEGGGDVSRRRALGRKVRECVVDIGGVDVVEVAVGVRRVVVEARRGVLARHDPLEPVPLHLGHVPDESQQREPRRRHRAGPELLGRQPLALHEQRRPVVLEPRVEHRALVGLERVGRSGLVFHAPRLPRAPYPAGCDSRRRAVHRRARRGGRHLPDRRGGDGHHARRCPRGRNVRPVPLGTDHRPRPRNRVRARRRRSRSVRLCCPIG